MPEGPEVDLDALHERIEEEVKEAEQREGGRFLRFVALTTACLAALAAIASLQAGATVNEALVLKTEAAQLQTRASDQWAYYQAKGIKEAVARASITSWEAAGHSAPRELTATVERYGTQQNEIAKEAHKLEAERDQRAIEADHYLHRHHGFASAVALFQVAIALGAVTALTRSRSVYVGSLALGALGIAFLVKQYL